MEITQLSLTFSLQMLYNKSATLYNFTTQIVFLAYTWQMWSRARIFSFSVVNSNAALSPYGAGQSMIASVLYHPPRLFQGLLQHLFSILQLVFPVQYVRLNQQKQPDLLALQRF